MIKKIETVLTGILEGLLAMCFLSMVTIVITLVVLRYAFNSSITGANEAVTILFVYTTALGAAVAVGRREHISITFAAECLPPHGRKLADAAGLVLVASLNGVMLVYSIGWIRITGDYLMPTTGLPRMVAQLSIPLGCGLAIAYCLLRLVLAFIGEEELGTNWIREE